MWIHFVTTGPTSGVFKGSCHFHIDFSDALVIAWAAHQAVRSCWDTAVFIMSKMAPRRHSSIWNSTKWWPLESANSLLPSCRLSVLHASTRYTHTLLCAHTKTHLHPLSLMCQRLLIMRFLQDGKLQGDWLMAHFKRCSLPLLFLSFETQRMKAEWGRTVKTHWITRSHIHPHT